MLSCIRKLEDNRKCIKELNNIRRKLGNRKKHVDNHLLMIKNNRNKNWNKIIKKKIKIMLIKDIELKLNEWSIKSIMLTLFI